MKLLWSLLAGCCIGLVQAQSPDSPPGGLSQLPECAVTCLAAILPSSPCSPTNTTCMCTNTEFQQMAGGCLTGSCTVPEILFVQNVTATSCGLPIRSRSGVFEATAVSFTVVATLLVFMRFGYKIYAHLSLGLDDWFTLLTLLLAISCTGFVIYSAGNKVAGRDIWTLTPDQITLSIYHTYIVSILYYAEVSSLKMAFLFFFLRVFLLHPTRGILWGLVVFNGIYGLLYIFLGAFKCRPISFIWLGWKGAAHGHCLDEGALLWSNALISIGLDLIMLAIPLSQLRGLTLSFKKKLGVFVMFSLGALVTIISALRLQGLAALRLSSRNPTWDLVLVGIWSNLEINVGIICACLPTIRLILIRLFPKQFGSTQHDYSDYSNKGKQKRSDHSALWTADEVIQPPRRTESRGITCERSYAVEFGESDETHLVPLGQLDSKSCRSEVLTER